MAKDAKGHGSDGRGGGSSKQTLGEAVRSDPQVRNAFALAAKYGPEDQRVGQAVRDMASSEAQTAATAAAHSGEAHTAAIAAAHGIGTGHLIESYNPKVGPSPEQMRANAQTMYGGGSSRYNKGAVDSAIASSRRAGQRIGGKEAASIHRLLKGRH